MTVVSWDGCFECNDPVLLVFHESRESPVEALCIKDNPPMTGFGKNLVAGDRVTVKGTVSRGSAFEVCVPSECAFYEYSYFVPLELPTQKSSDEAALLAIRSDPNNAPLLDALRPIILDEGEQELERIAHENRLTSEHLWSRGMIYNAPSHRGCVLATEQKQAKRRFYRPGLRQSHSAMLKALKASNDALEAERIAIERDQEILFLADCSDPRYLKLVHKQFHPRG
jgi:hypothetical protein